MLQSGLGQEFVGEQRWEFDCQRGTDQCYVYMNHFLLKMIAENTTQNKMNSFTNLFSEDISEC